MDAVMKGWFTEFSPGDFQMLQSPGDADATPIGGAWPGQAFSLQVEQVLFHQRSTYQDVLVFKSKTYGNVLVLDGVIQCTERDEFAYQEMLTHLAMCSHAHPQKVLIIGGGDGGVLREVLKHDCVELVVMCEIDEMVIDVSKQYLRHMSQAFNSPKLNLFVGDGFEFLKQHKGQFDVIITDSSDPVGPAESLFGDAYYRLLKEAMKPGAESIWLHLDLIAHMIAFTRQIFSNVRYASSAVSTYPSGSMGYLIASDTECDLSVPKRELSSDELKAMKLRYYNSQVHRAAFVLPQFVKEVLDAKNNDSKA